MSDRNCSHHWIPGLIGLGLLTLALVGGHHFGLDESVPSKRNAAPNTFTFLGLAGIALAILGLLQAVYERVLEVQSRTAGQEFVPVGGRCLSKAEFLLVGAIIGYMVLIFVSDPFLFSHLYDYGKLVEAIASLVPLIVAAVYHSGRSNYLLAAGSATFMMAMLAVLTFNTRFSDCSIGFHSAAFGR